MEKVKIIHRIALLMVAMLCVFASCSKDDDTEKEQSSRDPEGTIVMNMMSGNQEGYQIGDLAVIYMDASNNFTSSQPDVEFVSVGEVKGLSKITSIPASGWAKSVAVMEKTGYIMRSNSRYARIYVDNLQRSDKFNDYGRITGATIKYQAPWEVGK